MEHWSKTSCMEPLPLGRRNDKKKLPQDGHQARFGILENGGPKTEIRWEKKQAAQSSGKTTTTRLLLHDDQAKCSHSEVKARTRVTHILHAFRTYCDKISDMRRNNLNEKERNFKRVDLQAAKMVKSQLGYGTKKRCLGQVSGVQVGDIFCCRMELHILGLHQPPQSGIDTMYYGGEKIATSIVASGGYNDYWKDVNTLIYCGHGGNYGSGNQENVEDQKLVGGNLALWNSLRAKKPVRVIKGQKKMKAYNRFSTIYIYDGLFTVEDMWKVKNSIHHKIIFKFTLVRISG